MVWWLLMVDLYSPLFYIFGHVCKGKGFFDIVSFEYSHKMRWLIAFRVLVLTEKSVKTLTVEIRDLKWFSFDFLLKQLASTKKPPSCFPPFKKVILHVLLIHLKRAPALCSRPNSRYSLVCNSHLFLHVLSLLFRLLSLSLNQTTTTPLLSSPFPT